MKKKTIALFIVAVLLVIYYVFDITPISYQYRLSEHRDLGKEVTFSQPIGYIVRKHPAIVPVIAKIQNELGPVHPKGLYDDEKINQYIPLNTTFTTTDIYAYADIMNKQTLYYVLSDNTGKKYVIGEYFYKKLRQPVYSNAKVPTETIDKLYFGKHSIRMNFYTIEKRNPRLTEEYFHVCKVKDFSIKSWEREATATVDFTNLVCLYNYFWNDFNSEMYPIVFEIAK